MARTAQNKAKMVKNPKYTKKTQAQPEKEKETETEKVLVLNSFVK